LSGIAIRLTRAGRETKNFPLARRIGFRNNTAQIAGFGMVAQRHDLVAALVASAEPALRPRARRFVVGLSADEMQFIAEYLGACILESQRCCCSSRAELAERIAGFQDARKSSGDWDHKSILLLEFLCRTNGDGGRIS
jgi:hypothetical protein